MKMLPFCEPLRRRMQIKARKIKPRRRMAPMIDPMTMPAIAPPERPLLASSAACATDDTVAVAVAVVVVVKSAGRSLTDDGSVTPVHLCVTFDEEQHESVAFGELAAQ